MNTRSFFTIGRIYVIIFFAILIIVTVCHAKIVSTNNDIVFFAHYTNGEKDNGFIVLKDGSKYDFDLSTIGYQNKKVLGVLSDLLRKDVLAKDSANYSWLVNQLSINNIPENTDQVKDYDKSNGITYYYYIENMKAYFLYSKAETPGTDSFAVTLKEELST